MEEYEGNERRNGLVVDLLQMDIQHKGSDQRSRENDHDDGQVKNALNLTIFTDVFRIYTKKRHIIGCTLWQDLIEIEALFDLRWHLLTDHHHQNAHGQ